MDTRNLYTNLPEQINRQIEQKTQVNDINTQSVATTMQDGIEPIYVSQLNNPFDTNIPPAMPQIQWIVRYEKGLPIVDMTIIFTGKDKLGHDVNGQVLADIYRDLDNDGTFEDDELIDSIDLQTTNKFIDRNVPKDEIVRYKILLKNMSNRQQTWSEPITVSTSDKIIPYTPPIGVDPETSLDEIVVLTDNVNSITNGDNCNAVVKIKEHADDDLRMFEIQMRVVGATNWEKQPDVLANSALVDGYYYIGLKNLVRGTCYEIQVRVQRNSGNVSSWSDIISFMAGDYIGPQKPEKAYAVNISTEAALGMQVCWSSPLATGNNGISEYKLYRWTYLNAASTFVDGSKTLIGTFAVTDINKITWAYIDTTVETGNYYAYEIIAYDNSDGKNPSTSTFTFPDLVVAIVDSETITVSYDNNDLTFPITVEWTYAGGYHGTYIALRENDEQKRILFQKDLPNSIKEYTITLQDFKEVDAKDFLEIDAWQTTHNYTVEIGSVYNATSAGTRRQRVAYETLLINPKPSDVADFIATYDAIRHQMDFKWTKNADAFLTGYEIRRISLAQWEALEAITGETDQDITDRRSIWNNGTVVADARILNKDITDWTWQMPIGVDPSPADAVAYYFLIRAVGDFFVDYKYRSADFSKIIYSKESSKYTASVLQQLPAPTVDTSTYTSAVLDGTVMRINWQISLTADQKRQFKEFWLYMSTTATDVDNFDSTYRVWRGADLTTVLEKDHLGATLNYATTYYFRVVAVDHYDNPGLLSERFTNYPAGVLAPLPQCKITGVTIIRSIPIELNSISTTPLNDSNLIDIYNTRTMQFEIPMAFTKSIYADRVRWYISTNNGPYVLATETFFDKESINKAALIPAGFKQTYSFNSDKVLFQVKAVQYRPDGAEGSLFATTASRYSKIDTASPSVEIQKTLYKSTGLNAINKNGYVNKNILSQGIDIYYRSFEKESNSGIQKTEYTYNGGSTWIVSTGSPINITNAMLGADTTGGLYKDFEIKIKAYDNADNTFEETVRFKKDTVGPSGDELPTELKWAFGKDIKLSWTNPSTTNRNLYDGLKLFMGGILDDAEEYTIDANPYLFRPTSSPVELYLAAFDIADNYTYLDKDGVAQESATKITITNLAPAAPTNVIVEALVGGAAVSWDIVNTTVPEDPLDLTTIQEEEVEKYLVEYAIAETKPVAGSASWIAPATGGTTYTTNLNVSLSASEMDQFADNGSLKLWIRVKAVDYWALAGDWSTDNAFGYPKNITAVDMGNNIFKFKLSSDKTLVPYVNEGPSGTTQHILDANYIDAEHVRFTVDSTTNNYIKIDMNKVEWISHIKLKFRHSSTVRFVIKLEEVSGATTQDVWLQSSSTSNHDFTEVNEIVVTSFKPDANRYFEFSTTNSNIVDIAELKYTNFDTGKAILAKSVSIYFYSANGTEIKMVEFQPVVMSIANIFYGSEINLDTLVSIKSTSDLINYVYLTKFGLTIYGNNGSGVSEQKITIGYLDTNIYGAWLRDRVYIGGTAYSNAPIQISASSMSISLGGLSATPSASSISGANGTFSTGGGLSTNYLSGNASSATMGVTDSQVSATSSGAEIKQKVGVDTTKGWSQYNNYYIQFGVGTTYGTDVRAQFGRLAANVYGSWMTNGVYIGGTSYTNCEVRLTASTLEMGYISANTYNMTLTSSVLSIGRIGSYYNAKIEAATVSLGHVSSGTNYNAKIEAATISLGYNATGYATVISATEIKMKLPSESNYNLSITSGQIGLGHTGGYYNTKITGSAISLGHISSGTSYKLTLSSTEINMLGYDNATSFFKVGQYNLNSTATNTIWSKKLWLSTSSGDNPTLSALDANMKLIITGSDSLRNALIRNAFSDSGSTDINSVALRCECLKGFGIIATSEHTGTANTVAAIIGECGATNQSGTGVLGSGNLGYGIKGASINNTAIYGLTTVAVSSPAIHGVHNAAGVGVRGDSSGTAVYGESTAGTGVSGYGVTGGGFYGSTYAINSTGPVRMYSLSDAGTGTDLVIDASYLIRPKSSSIRHKEILSGVEDFSMLKFSQLVPYKFRFKGSGHIDIGYIAEWVEPLFPDLVNYGNDGLPVSLKYDRFCVYNILATQEHQREIISLKSELAELKQIINELKNKIDSM